ncbi:RtcB family protein [Pelobacter seleniigenes]|uniref:RtcB family protein n=1 Tax=Pelobacter seleniigenes TaxID=407188 RepID=UPI0004A6C5C1|nr:RtcB family protein [Pelobacter seleniigenes]
MSLKPEATTDPFVWRIPPQGRMQVPAIIYADRRLLGQMDSKVFEQLANVAGLPGIQGAAYAMPDAHWGYGFPIGGVAAFAAEEGGVISAGGVGFDISCGVRTLHTGLNREQLAARKTELADRLARDIPAGVGSTGPLRLNQRSMDQMLSGGAAWAVEQGYGSTADLERIEEQGRVEGAVPQEVSAKAKQRQQDQMGTLGSGNHYLEIQEVEQIFDAAAAAGFGLQQGDILVSIHCGSRGLGHQIGTEFLAAMVAAAPRHGLQLPDRELACAPIDSALGRSYLGAMRAAINCALANRQILTQLCREAFAKVLRQAELRLLYDVSHNTCKFEQHLVNDRPKKLFVHRKGATRAYGPGHPELPPGLRDIGQPVLIGGSMGTSSYILVGTTAGATQAFSSSCHGAGRAMSRRQASKRWRGKELIATLQEQGILIRSPSLRGVAEEAPGAYKEVNQVIEAADRAGLSRKVARLKPLICIKG